MTLPSFFVAVLLASAPDPSVRLIEPSLDGVRAYARIADLVDRVGHRLSGSPGAERGIAWALAEFEEDGLKAWREPMMAPRWERGTASAQVLAGPSNVEHELAVVALGGSPGTSGVTAELVAVRSLAELALQAERVRGKIVFFDHDMSVADDYGKYGGLRNRGPAEAAKLGAQAALVRSLATASLRSPHTGNTTWVAGGPMIPAAAISTEDAALLSRLLVKGPVRVRLTLGCVRHPDVPSANVVAEIRGREKPDEIVLFGAHLDSWDLSPGAQDDAAGVAMVLEAARLIAQMKPAPRRTIRFVLFMSEETGLAGAKAYAERHAAELERHVAALEADIGAGKAKGVELKAGPGGEAFLRQLAAPLERLGAHGLSGDTAGGADLVPLDRAGVPLAGVWQDYARYFDVHHTAADTLDKIDLKALGSATAAFTWLTYALAEAKDTLPRVPAGNSRP